MSPVTRQSRIPSRRPSRIALHTDRMGGERRTSHAPGHHPSHPSGPASQAVQRRDGPGQRPGHRRADAVRGDVRRALAAMRRRHLERFTELETERETITTELAALAAQKPQQTSPELLNALPQIPANLAALPLRLRCMQALPGTRPATDLQTRHQPGHLPRHHHHQHPPHCRCHPSRQPRPRQRHSRNPPFGLRLCPWNDTQAMIMNSRAALAGQGYGPAGAGERREHYSVAARDYLL